MLKRKSNRFYEKLDKHKGIRKCLIVQGARQTGKTYTVERFAEENYEELVEINLNRCLLRWRYFLEILP